MSQIEKKLNSLRQRLIYSNNITEQKIVNSMEKVISLIEFEFDPYILSNAYCLIGELYIKINQEENAIEYFEAALDYNKDNAKAYISLLYYELNKNNKDLIKIKRLAAFACDILEKKENLDVRFNIIILNHLLNLISDYKNLNSLKVDSNIIDKPEKSVLVKKINEGRYKECKLYFQENNKTLSSCIILLLEQLIKLRKNASEDQIYTITNQYLDDKNYDALVDYLSEIYKKRPSIQNVCIDTSMKLFFRKEYGYALRLIYTVKRYDNDNEKVNILINRINEEIHYKLMPEARKKAFKNNKENIHNAFLEKNNLKTANYIIEGKRLYNDNIYNYFLGKYYYFNGDYEMARTYFLAYTKDGYKKLQKCYFYLFFIEYNNNGNYFKYYKKYLKLIELSKITNRKSKEAIKTMEQMIELKNTKIPKSERKNTKYIDMSVEYFEKEENNTFKYKKN